MKKMLRNSIDVEYDVNMVVDEIASTYDIDPGFVGDCWPSYVQECMRHMLGCDDDDYEYYLNEIRDVLTNQAKDFNESEAE